MSIQSIFEDDQGKMWVGINGGIFLVENGIARNLITDCHVFSIKGDPCGNVWAATNKRRYQFNDYKVTKLCQRQDGLPNEFATLVFEDSERARCGSAVTAASANLRMAGSEPHDQEGLTGNYVRAI